MAFTLSLPLSLPLSLVLSLALSLIPALVVALVIAPVCTFVLALVLAYALARTLVQRLEWSLLLLLRLSGKPMFVWLFFVPAPPLILMSGTLQLLRQALSQGVMWRSQQVEPPASFVRVRVVRGRVREEAVFAPPCACSSNVLLSIVRRGALPLHSAHDGSLRSLLKCCRRLMRCVQRRSAEGHLRRCPDLWRFRSPCWS
uniref:Uncharacterized protein n=1 Tax=Chrysotila carterae TaxID=13221 RepID=A0A7S4BK25_CHRCT